MESNDELTGAWFGGLTACVHLLVVLVATVLNPGAVLAQIPLLRVLTHSSFDLPKPLLEAFEQSNGVKLAVIKAGDAGEMVNKLILTKAQPIADVVYGIDNALAGKAIAMDVLTPYTGPAAQAASLASLPAPLVPIDLGYVAVNIDKAWFAKNKVAVPSRMQDLVAPLYKNLLVVQHPATSSPGMAFLASAVAAMGEDGAMDWWAKLRANGVKVTKGWSEAYYTHFSRNGGSRPMVVSYASSPAAEMFYAKTKLTEAPIESLELDGLVFQQVEGVALVKGGKQVEVAGQFIEFLRGAQVQQALQSTMWMYPAVPGVPLVSVLQHAVPPKRHQTPAPDVMTARSPNWVARWTQTVLR